MDAERLINWEPLAIAYKSLSSQWRFVAVISILAIILEFFYFILYVIPWSKMGVAEWAYWVGAIGSIGAIIGAFILASKQSRDSAALQAATAAKQKNERDQSVRLVIDHCYAAICGLPGRLQRREDYEMHLKSVPRTVFTNLQKLLSVAPLYEVTDEKIVVAAMLMMDAMDSTMVLIAEIDNMSPGQRIAFWNNLAARLEDQRARARGIRWNLYAQ